MTENIIRIPDIEHDDDTCPRVNYDRAGNAFRCTLEPGHQGVDEEWCHHHGTGQYWHPDGARVSWWTLHGLDFAGYVAGIVSFLMSAVLLLGMLRSEGIWPF